MTHDKSVPAWKERAQNALRSAILDAARTTFAEHGYAGATVDEIATRAEVGKGTIYNYFEGGKAGLFVAVLSDHFDDLHALAQHRMESPGPLRERFHAFAADMIVYFDTHQDLLRVHLREVPQLLAASGDRTQTENLKGRRDRVIETLVPPIERAIAEGELRPIPALLTAQIAFGLLVATVIRTVEVCPGTVRIDSKEAADYLAAFLFDGIEARVGTQG